MSTAAVAAGGTPPSANAIAGLGLGYAVAIAIALLVILSALILTVFICFKPRSTNPNPNPNSAVILPRIIFVAEDDDDGEDGGGRGSNAGAGLGLDQSAINCYPKFCFSAGDGEDNVCSICLCEYREGEVLRMMPDCCHCFHIVCIDAWLRLNASCPVCRNSPMPTPLSTPLAEIVPLSQYGDDRRRR